MGKIEMLTNDDPPTQSIQKGEEDLTPPAEGNSIFQI